MSAVPSRRASQLPSQLPGRLLSRVAGQVAEREPRGARAPAVAGAAAVALAVMLTGCGAAEPDTAEPVDREGASAGASTSTSPGGSTSPGASAGGELEQITPGGIALVVLDHFGRDAVRQLATFEPEPGSVSLLVRLSEAGRADNFAVSVYSPEQGSGELGRAGKCPPKRERRGFGESECRTLDNGTTLMTSEVSEGFSDDNADGMVVFGTAITPEDGTAMAMYESYDATPAVSARDLERLLTDPRLTWLTDPAVNEAGKDAGVKQLTG